MRNTFYIKNKLRLALMAPALALSLMMTSCEKETLELTPVDRLTEESSFETPERVELAMNGVYDAAQSGFYSGGAVRGYPFGAAHISQGDMRGEDMLNIAAFYAYTYESTIDATSTLNNVYMWETLYSLINKANVVMEGVQKAVEGGVISADQGKIYEGELKFLRAMAHHELLVNFARPYNETSDASHPGVPYRTIPVNTPARVDEAKSQGRNTVAESYALLLQDLNDAEANLPATRPEQITRATQGAAIAFKTRVKLHMGDWNGVKTEAEKIVSGSESFTSPIGGYSLTETPEGPFANDDSNSESIFSIQNSPVDNSGVNGALSNMYTGSNRALVAISPIIWNAEFWPEEDLRRSQLTADFYDGERYTTKYRDLSTFSDNAPVVRYAEVLLNYSEAIVRTEGVTDKALALLNAVRGRATDELYSTSAAGYLGVGSTQDMLLALANERRIEFLAEGMRWKDIHRTAKTGDFGVTGIPAKVFYNETDPSDWDAASGNVRPALLVNIPALDYSDDKFLWPIPTSETSRNPVLAAQQNPGY